MWHHLLTWGLSEFDLAEEGFFLIPQKTKTYLIELLNFGFYRPEQEHYE